MLATVPHVKKHQGSGISMINCILQNIPENLVSRLQARSAFWEWSDRSRIAKG
jgi:hypothetical protein